MERGHDPLDSGGRRERAAMVGRCRRRYADRRGAARLVAPDAEGRTAPGRGRPARAGPAPPADAPTEAAPGPARPVPGVSEGQRQAPLRRAGGAPHLPFGRSRLRPDGHASTCRAARIARPAPRSPARPGGCSTACSPRSAATATRLSRRSVLPALADRQLHRRDGEAMRPARAPPDRRSSRRRRCSCSATPPRGPARPLGRPGAGALARNRHASRHG